MSARNTILLILLLTIVHTTLSVDVTTANNERDEAVVHLTKDTFDRFVNSGDSGPWFIMFHAPWCPHCQHAAPAFKQLATTTKGGVRIGMVDCVANPSLASKFNIQGYPTFLYFDQGSKEQFNGDRSVEAWTQFIDSKSKPVTAGGAPVIPTAFEMPSEGPSAGKPGITVEKLDEVQGRFQKSSRYFYNELWVVLALVASFVICTVLAFYCLQRFRVKYSAVNTSEEREGVDSITNGARVHQNQIGQVMKV